MNAGRAQHFSGCENEKNRDHSGLFRERRRRVRTPGEDFQNSRHRPALHSPPVRAEVPASTSNLGPGYDCLGVALNAHNAVTVRKTEAAPSGDRETVEPAHPMAEETAALFFQEALNQGVDRFPFCWEIAGDVPISRGLGSSVTLRLGLLAGLNALAGEPFSRETLFHLCTKLEGHPDNAGPAAFGGFFVGHPDGAYQRYEVDPDLKFVLLIRELEVLTEKARRVLPPSLLFPSAVINVGNAAAVAAAFAARNYAALRGTFVDHLHQPWRETLNPGLSEIIQAGEAAGALGGFLSGSGSTVCCLSLKADTADIAAAMTQACPDEAPPKTAVLRADNAGIRVSELVASVEE